MLKIPSVGDSVYVVPHYRWGEPYGATVTKVGRKWFHAGRERYDIQSGLEDGGQYISRATAYTSQEEHEEIMKRNATAKALRDAINRSSNDDLLQAVGGVMGASALAASLQAGKPTMGARVVNT